MKTTTSRRAPKGAPKINPSKPRTHRRTLLATTAPARETLAASESMPAPQATIAPALEPALMSVPAACAYSGFSRSELYRRLGARLIEARKVGRAVRIVTASLKAHLASLPPATFRAPRRAA